ncbi:MAG TPA: VOC family protein [Patescibacteria group bacterium]|nr:VOC family protein [Patescibacteria group bacterium]
MITGAHAIIYCEDPEAARKFFRDVLGFPSVDAGEGWLIFRLPPSEIAMHPDPAIKRGESRHELFLTCGDLEATMGELRAKGAELVLPVRAAAWGSIVRIRVPGAGEVSLYQPKHPTAAG